MLAKRADDGVTVSICGGEVELGVLKEVGRSFVAELKIHKEEASNYGESGR